MDLFLTILKLSGIIVAGALGILGTVTETRNKETGRLTRWGKWALKLTIAGFLTALGAQIAEQFKGQRDSQKSQNLTNRQLIKTEQSLKYLERIATRFDTLSFSVTYELEATNYFFDPLWEFIHTFTGPGNLSSPAAISADLHSLKESQAVSQTFAGKGSNSEQTVYSLNIVGYRDSSNSNTECYSLGINNAGGIEFFLPPKRDLLSYLKDNSTPLPEFDKVLDFLAGPRCSIALYTHQSAILRTPDLYVLATNLMEPPKLVYYPNPKTLTITWVFSCPKSDWKQPKRMLSLPDLANASLCHSILDAPPQIAGHLRAIDGELTVDLTKVQLRDFAKMSRPDSATNSFYYDYAFVKDSFVNSTSQGLSEDGDYSIVWSHLYESRFPDEKQMDQVLGKQLPQE
jgi:hypothetical protein